MGTYIIRRLLLLIPTFILVTMTVFLLIRFIPGDLIDIMLSEMGDTGVQYDRTALQHQLGLDESAPIQYLRWMGVFPDRDTGEHTGVLQGSLGDSLWGRSSVIEKILPRIPVSLELGILAMIIGLVIAIPIGIFSAIRQDTAGDYIGRSFAIILLAVPGFWVATMVMVYPSIWWNWMPPIRYIPFSKDPIANLGQFLIPATIMAMALAGGVMRLTRTMMLEVLRQDYIRTAWSKGLGERVVVVRHALRNAVIPIVTSVGIQIPIVIGSAVIMENIFNLPGIGRLAITSLNIRDYTVVSGVNVLMALIVLTNNLIIDLTYGFLDPRVRYD